MKYDLKKHPMTFTQAARLLAEEHPEIAFSAVQLRSMAQRRVIPCLQLQSCGTIRKTYKMVNYPELVKHLLSCKIDAIA